jgi:hypothetical protein
VAIARESPITGGGNDKREVVSGGEAAKGKSFPNEDHDVATPQTARLNLSFFPFTMAANPDEDTEL